MHVQVTSLEHIPTGTDHMYDGEGFGITFEIEGYNKSYPNHGSFDGPVSDADDNPQKEGKSKSEGPVTKKPQNQDNQLSSSTSGGGEQQGSKQTTSVQVGSMLLKVSPASDSKIKINTMSSRWGDRAEMEEALPSPLAASAPPKISCWKNSSSLPQSLSAAAEKSVVTSAATEIPPDQPAAAVEKFEPAASEQMVRMDEDVSELPVISAPQNHFNSGLILDDLALPAAPGFRGSPVRSMDTLSGCVSQKVESAPVTPCSSLCTRQEATVHSVSRSASSLPCSPGGVTRRSLSPRTPTGTGVFLGGRYSQADVAAFGGVPIAGIRSSERIRKQPNADSTQLERAQEIAKHRNQALDSGKSNLSKYSIASFPNELIVTRAAKLGVSLGGTPTQVLNAVNNLKGVDLQRTLVMLKRNEEKIKNSVDEVSTAVLQDAIDLSVDLEEEEQQGSFGHEDQVLPVIKKKRVVKKKQTEYTSVRRSKRLKLKRAQ
jgi:hypothetical protein